MTETPRRSAEQLPPLTEIELQAVPVDAELPYNLFIKVAGRYVKYRHRGDPLEHQAQERLLSVGVRVMYWDKSTEETKIEGSHMEEEIDRLLGSVAAVEDETQKIAGDIAELETSQTVKGGEAEEDDSDVSFGGLKEEKETSQTVSGSSEEEEEEMTVIKGGSSTNPQDEIMRVRSLNNMKQEDNDLLLKELGDIALDDSADPHGKKKKKRAAEEEAGNLEVEADAGENEERSESSDDALFKAADEEMAALEKKKKRNEESEEDEEAKRIMAEIGLEGDGALGSVEQEAHNDAHEEKDALETNSEKNEISELENFEAPETEATHEGLSAGNTEEAKAEAKAAAQERKRIQMTMSIIQKLQNMEKRNPKDLTIKVALGKAYLDAHRLDEALQLYKQMKRNFPKSGAGSAGLVETYLAKKWTSKALDEMEGFKKAFPQDNSLERLEHILKERAEEEEKERSRQRDEAKRKREAQANSHQQNLDRIFKK